MAGVNKVIIVGNCGKDPEVTYTPGGMAIAKFSVATSERKKNDAGDWEESTDWHRVVLFGKTAEAAGTYLTKGKQVFIEGRISYSTFEKEGVKQYFTDIIGSRMVMLGSKGDSPAQQPAQQPAPQSTPSSQYEETDLPF